MPFCPLLCNVGLSLSLSQFVGKKAELPRRLTIHYDHHSIKSVSYLYRTARQLVLERYDHRDLIARDYDDQYTTPEAYEYHVNVNRLTRPLGRGTYHPEVFSQHVR